MNKFQPKIFSLSTINIRQHFNCDYKFHEFRTDFTGESGSGKSLIADFLQLLLVGSKFFKSGTEGVDSRDTSGLVLKASKHNFGRGYIFINVEVQPQRFIVMGGYLESNQNQMQLFIIQSGYDFEETLIPMEQPIFYEDLLLNNNVETLSILQQNFTKGYLKVLSRKNYHSLLFKNGILSVDLSHNEQSLKSYGNIIRAFSRGKGFFSDSPALKTFLFGDDDHKILVEKYRDEVQNISLDKQQHQRLLDEVELIKNKELKIERVINDYAHLQKVKKEYSRNCVNFWCKEHKIVQEKLAKFEQEHRKVVIEKTIIDRKLCEHKLKFLEEEDFKIKKLKGDLKNSNEDLNLMQMQVKQANDKLNDSKKSKDIIDKVNRWFDAERITLEDIRKWYAAERKKVQNQEILESFSKHLNEHNITKAFDNSFWLRDYSNAEELADRHQNNLLQRKADIENQLIFSDFDNPDSLGQWAIQNLNLPLSLETESLLMHFQTLQREAPIPAQDRYLPFPEILFKEPIIVPASNLGFWVELNGIHEFIKIVQSQVLNITKDEIQLDTRSREELQGELDDINQELKSFAFLREKLKDFPSLKTAINIYQERSKILFENLDPISELTNSEFENHLSTFNRSDQLLAIFEQDERTYKELFENLVRIQSSEEHIQKLIKESEEKVEQQFGPGDLEAFYKDEQGAYHQLDKELNSFYEDNSLVKFATKFEIELSSSPKSLHILYGLSQEKHAEIVENKQNIISQKAFLEKCDGKLKETKGVFLMNHERDFNPDVDYSEVDKEPDKTASDNAFKAFELSYDLASEGIEDKTILKQRSVGVLAHKLLPTVFNSQQIEEEQINDKIEKRLTDLTNDLKEIGSRKLEILHNVFNEVLSVYNGYLTKVNKINNYLQSKDRKITGGNSATLLYHNAAGYPDEWMKVFRKRLTNEMQYVGLFESANKQDIDDIMLTVFRELNGTTAATVDDLLNPRSYFDLRFEMKLDDGQKNSGSNGQTYTANALLCLARLSLIEDGEQTGLRVMPIDEAEGLGSNFEMLHQLARRENYQLVTMSIEAAGDLNQDGQYIYIMQDNKGADGASYVPPLAIFNKGELTDNIHEIFKKAE